MASWAFGLYGWQHPLPNWDLIPYAALVRTQAGMSPEALSRETYAEVRQYVGEQKFRPMVEGGEADAGYRATLYANPAALADNLKFYSVKPLYVWLARMARPLVGNSASAAVLVSASALALLLTLAPFFFRRRLVAVAGLWLLMFAGEPDIWIMASCATPDTLSLLLVMCSSLVAIRHGHWVVVGSLSLLAVTARPDAAVFLVPLLAGLTLFEASSGQRLPFAGCTTAVLAFFVFLGKQALPWSTLFWHTFVRREPFPSEVSYVVTPEAYLQVVTRTLPHVLSPRPLVFLVAAVLLALLPLLLRRQILAFHWMAAVASGNMVLHYLIFPIDEFGHERMFLASYFVVSAAALLALEHVEHPVHRVRPLA